MSSLETSERDISERLRSLRKSEGLSQTEMASKIDRSQQTWGSYESGDTTPPLSILQTLVVEFDLNPAWMLLGEGEMDDQLIAEDKRPYFTEELPDDFDPESVSFVPVYGAPLGAGQAGNAAMVNVRGYMAWEKSWLRREAKIEPSRAFVAQVFGQSMEDLLENGDLVLGEMQDRVDHDGVYAIRWEDELFIKHVVRKRDSIVMISENDLYGRTEVGKHEDLSVIGRIVIRVGDL